VSWGIERFATSADAVASFAVTFTPPLQFLILLVASWLDRGALGVPPNRASRHVNRRA
jgi:hypothetical protein